MIYREIRKIDRNQIDILYKVDSESEFQTGETIWSGLLFGSAILNTVTLEMDWINVFFNFSKAYGETFFGFSCYNCIRKFCSVFRMNDVISNIAISLMQMSIVSPSLPANALRFHDYTEFSIRNIHSLFLANHCIKLYIMTQQHKTSVNFPMKLYRFIFYIQCYGSKIQNISRRV